MRTVAFRIMKAAQSSVGRCSASDEILKSGDTSRGYFAEGSHLIGARIFGRPVMLVESRLTIPPSHQFVEVLQPYCS